MNSQKSTPALLSLAILLLASTWAMTVSCGAAQEQHRSEVAATLSEMQQSSAWSKRHLLEEGLTVAIKDKPGAVIITYRIVE